MNRLLRMLIAAALLTASGSSFAWWGGWNPWPVWTPMYWMEEAFGDDYWDGPYGHGPYGYGPGWYGPYSGWGHPYRGYPYGAWGPYRHW